MDPTSADVVSKRTGLWPSVALTALGLVVIAAYSSFGRPLWIDEFVHFALSGLPPQEAMTALYRSLGPNLSHGQTGLYMLFDYWALWWAGANLFLFRLPSILSGALLLLSAVAILRLKGFSPWWQALVIMALSAQTVLMFHTGNARPYMMLTATSVAMVAYYLYPVAARRALLPRTLGVAGIIVGSMAHPYFAVFLPLAIVFGLWEQRFSSGLRLSRSTVLAFVNLRFVIPAGVLFFAVGSLTWLRGTPDFALDPWKWMQPSGAARMFVMTHMGMLVPVNEYPPRVFLLLAGFVLLVLAAITLSARDRRLVPPLVLFAVALLSSVFFSAVSIVTNYWVMERQWVVGAALAAVGLVWLLAQSFTVFRERASGVGKVLVAVVAAFIVLTGTVAAVGGLRAIPRWQQAWEDIRVSVPADAATRTLEGLDDDGLVDLANQNVAVGGPVWPSIGEYYRPYVEGTTER